MTSQQVLAAIVAVVLLGWHFWPGIKSLASGLKLPAFSWGFLGGSTKPAADIDVTDLAALKVMQARFVRLNCAEGQAAVKVLFDHFFHEGPKA